MKRFAVCGSLVVLGSIAVGGAGCKHADPSSRAEQVEAQPITTAADANALSAVAGNTAEHQDHASHHARPPDVAATSGASGAEGHVDHGGHSVGGHGHHHRFDDAKQWSAVFDDPARDTWQKPEAVLAAMKLTSKMKVADLGAGTGYFSSRIAKVVTKGTVFAADIEPDMVRHLDERAKKDNTPNVRGVLSAENDAKLPEPVDAVLIVDTYHHISERPAYFQKLKASLKPKGKLFVVDFKPESKMGPKHGKLAASAVEAELREAGYVLEPSRVELPEQYLLVFRAAR